MLLYCAKTVSMLKLISTSSKHSKTFCFLARCFQNFIQGRSKERTKGKMGNFLQGPMLPPPPPPPPPPTPLQQAEMRAAGLESKLEKMQREHKLATDN
jgi:hypothetical protein